MRKLYWVLLILVIVVLFLIYQCDQMFGDLFEYTNIEELVENWQNKEKEIRNLKSFYKSISRSDLIISIEFDSDDKISLWVSEKVDSARFGRINWFQEWDIDLENYKIPEPSKRYQSDFGPKIRSLDKILDTLNWQRKTLLEIQQNLDNANCISITNGEPTRIGFKRSGFGKYFYNVYDKPIVDSLKSSFNDSCTYVFYDSKLILEFGGGAIGPQCFPDFR